MRTIPARSVPADFSQSRDFRYIHNFLGQAQASRLLELFWAELNWQQEEIQLFGRKIPQPRLTSWYGDPDARYTYSGLHLEPQAWHPVLLELRTHLEDFLQRRFNSVLANGYRDGRDSMGWHADDEKELGTGPVIASLSLGACRRFLLRDRRGNETMCLPLEHGSLLIMQGASQSAWKHSLPKTTRPVGLRINLTFRKVANQ